MPTCASTVRTLPRELAIGVGEPIDALMDRVDRDEVRQVCRHLLGDLALRGGRDVSRDRASSASGQQ